MEDNNTTKIDTTDRLRPQIGTDDAEMNSSAAVKQAPTVLEQLQRDVAEPWIPEQITDQLNRDLWKLKIFLTNYQGEMRREFTERGLSLTASRRQAIGAFPALDCEKRIMELTQKLWEQRDQIKTRFFQLPPYEVHFNPERSKVQVFILLQQFVTDQCNHFKKTKEGVEEFDETDLDSWDPILNKQQVLIFLQLAEALLKQVSNPSFAISFKNKAETLFNSVLRFEDQEIMRCCMAVCMNKEPQAYNRKDEVPSWIYYPIISCPYKMFPGEKKPISRLLREELPLKMDIEFEHETQEKGPDGKNIKQKFVIPFEDFSKYDVEAKRGAFVFFLQSQAHLKLMYQEKDFKLVQSVLFRMNTIRALTNEAARQRCIQLWLMTMMQTKKTQVQPLTQLLDFSVQDFVEDMFELLKITKDEQTCEQILSLIRSFVNDEPKFYNIIGLKSLEDLPEVSESGEQASAWIKNSFAYKLTKQMTSMAMVVSQVDDAKPVQEKSAFDVDMSEQDVNTGAKLSSFVVTRTLPEQTDEVIPSAMLLCPRVQIAAARLLNTIISFERYQERNRLQETEQRIVQGLNHIRKLSRELLNTDSLIVTDEGKVGLLKYHPLLTMLLIDTSFEDVYLQDELNSFKILETKVLSWIDLFSKGKIYYCGSPTSSEDSFELDTEYKGRMIKALLRPLGTIGFQRERHASQRSPNFPGRLVESTILEKFRTNYLQASNDQPMAEFVNEFLEDFVKVIVKIIDRDAAMIKKFLHEPKGNNNVPPEGENSSPWDAKGLIPLIFERIRICMPVKYFIYNTVLDLIRQMCILPETIEFIELRGGETLQRIFDSKCELPQVYLQDQRLFFQVSPLNSDTFVNIQRNVPFILGMLSMHFNQTLDKIKSQSFELCQAQYTYINSLKIQNYGYQRKLRIRMEQTDQFEQLYYNISIIQGFIQSFNQQTQEMLSKLIEPPERILEVLAIFENLCLFKNLQSFVSKLVNLLKLILTEQQPGRNPEQNDQLQLQQMEKFKVFAGRIKEITTGFVSFLGKPLDKMPNYDEMMAEPTICSNEEQKSAMVYTKGAKCPFDGLTRKQQFLWFVKIISDYASKLEKANGDQIRRDITLIEWDEVIQPLLLFLRVIPEKELAMFNQTMLESETDFTEAHKNLACFTAERKKQVGQLRSSLREKLKAKDDFKSIVTSLAHKRKQFDQAFTYVKETHYELYGLQLADTLALPKLNRLINSSIMQSYKRAAPAQFILTIIRKNLREQAKALALLAKNVKQALPRFSLTDDSRLEQLLQTLSTNQMSIKPIKKWARDFQGTLLIHFVSLDGLKAIAQYQVTLQKLQQQIDEAVTSATNQVLQEMTEKQCMLVRLIVNQVHDSHTVTMALLQAFVVHPKDTKAYLLADFVEDSKPLPITSLQHFFANHYNQLLTILANWNENEADFAQLIERDSKLSYMGCDSVLIFLLKEAASNFINCPMLKDNFAQEMNRGYLGGGRAGLNAFLGGIQGQRNHPQAQVVVDQPARDPTPDELEMIMQMGFDVEMSTAAIQMSNFDVARGLELLLGGNEAQIIQFMDRQRALKEAEEKRQQDHEMEMALKMSMLDEEKIGEELSEEGQLVNVPIIEYSEFKDRVTSSIKKAVQSLMTSIRSNQTNVNIETVLSFIKVALIGQPTIGRNGEPGPIQKPLLELNEEHQSDQRAAIFSSVNEFVKLNLAGGHDETQIIQVLQRYEFDIKLREMGYLQMFQLSQEINEKHEAFAFLVSLITALQHIGTLMTQSTQKHAELVSETTIEIKEKKYRLVELSVKMMSVAVTTIQLIHVIVLSVCREHEKAIRKAEKDYRDQDKDGNLLADTQKDHAVQWVKSTTPNKIVIALAKLRHAIENIKDTQTMEKTSEVLNLADQALENICLTATHILSLRQWHYLKKDSEQELEWFSTEWLKTIALDFAIAYTKLGKRNDKFLNQLISVALYDYSALPYLSQNLLNVSLLYHTLDQTCSEEAKREASEEAKKDPHQQALDFFLEGGLKQSNSRVSYKVMFALLKSFHEANPLDISPDAKCLIEVFKANCSFSKSSENQRVESNQVGFTEKKLKEVQAEALHAGKTLDQRFASLDTISKTKIELLSGAFDLDPKNDSNEESKEGAEQPFFNSYQITKENKNLQAERIDKIFDQVKNLTRSSYVLRKLRGEAVASEDTAVESTLKTQCTLLQKVSMCTQVYPELTPRNDAFVDWFVSEWLLQLIWVQPSAKVADDKKHEQPLIPNSSLLSEWEKMERIINRLTGLNRFQTLSQRTIRMNLRVTFLEHALLGIANCQKTLSTLCSSASKQTISSESLAQVQMLRSKALICLSVIKALISDETVAMKNRITVIPETFQKSIYYLLLRGRPSKDRSQAPINLCKVVSSLIRLSERLLKIQERLAVPPTETSTLVNINAVSGNFLHGNMVSSSIACLIELCLFIEQHMHKRGKKPVKKQPPANDAGQIQIEAPQQLMQQQLVNNVDAVQERQFIAFQMPPYIQEHEIEQIQINPPLGEQGWGGPGDFQIQPEGVDVPDLIDAVMNEIEEEQEQDQDQDQDQDEDEDNDDDDDEDDDDEDDDDDDDIPPQGNVEMDIEYDDEEIDNDEDMYGEEMMDEEMDDLMDPAEIIQRRNIVPVSRNQRGRDIINQPQRGENERVHGDLLWDIGQQPEPRNERERLQDNSQWTQEEGQIQRSLQLLRGFRPHPTAVPQGMPERANQPDVFPRYVLAFGGRQENRGEQQAREDGNLPDENKSIRELTEVFKPLQQAEYLKAQAQLSEKFQAQLKKTQEALSKIQNKDDEKIEKEVVLSQTIRSEPGASNSPEARNRFTLLEQQRIQVEHLQQRFQNIAGHELEMQNHLEEILERIRHHEANFANMAELGLGEPVRFGGRPEVRQETDSSLGAGMARMIHQAEREAAPRRGEIEALMSDVLRLARGQDIEVQEAPGSIRRRSIDGSEINGADPAQAIFDRLFRASSGIAPPESFNMNAQVRDGRRYSMEIEPVQLARAQEPQQLQQPLIPLIPEQPLRPQQPDQPMQADGQFEPLGIGLLFAQRAQNASPQISPRPLFPQINQPSMIDPATLNSLNSIINFGELVGQPAIPEQQQEQQILDQPLIQALEESMQVSASAQEASQNVAMGSVESSNSGSNPALVSEEAKVEEGKVEEHKSASHMYPEEVKNVEQRPSAEVQQEISAFQIDEDDQREEQVQASRVTDADQLMEDVSRNQEQRPALEEQKNEPQAQAESPAEEEQTFGFPNSLLIANDIEPGILGELPEEIREGILAPLQEQLAQHRRAAEQILRANANLEERKQQFGAPNNNNAQAQPAARNNANAMGFEEDFLNALPEDVRQDVLNQGPQAMGGGGGPELDFISVITMTDDPALRRDMLMQLNETMSRQLPPNLRREQDQAREEAARHHQDTMRREAERRERQLLEEERNRVFGGMHGQAQNARNRHPRDDGGELGERKLDLIIETVEREIFEKQEQPHYKAQAKIIERQLETEDTLIETILRLIIQFSENKSEGSESSGISKEALENAKSTEIVFLICKLEDLRQAQSSCHTNRNKFANAFTKLLTGVIDENEDFKNSILADEEEGVANDEAMDIDEEQKQSNTVMIDTTQGSHQKQRADKTASSNKAQPTDQRSASLKLALMLIGTMRVVSKQFRVHLLKGMLLQEDYFQSKASSVIQKQSQVNRKQGKALQPPLVEILRATETVKHNLTSLENQFKTAENVNKQDLQKEIQSLKALLRNLNLLIIDIFKEFDQVIEKILSQQQSTIGEGQEKVEKKLTISQDSLVSLAKLLSLPEIEKKQLQSLGRAFLLMSKNCRDNWDLVHGEFQQIGASSLDFINEKLLQITIRFQAIQNLQKMPLSMDYTPSKADGEEEKKDIRQLKLREHPSLDKNSDLKLDRQASQQDQIQTKLSLEEQEELKKMIIQDKDALQVLKNTLTVYNQFGTEIVAIRALEEEQKSKGLFKPQAASADACLLAIESQLTDFYKNPSMLEHMTLVNDVLAILQSAKQPDLSKELMSNLACIFESHLPDLHDMIRRAGAVEQRPEAKIEIRMRPVQHKEQKNKKLSLFKNVDETISDRLKQFSVFCLNNKKAINKLLQGRGRANLGLQLNDIVKYMPNLLDFENKREYFYKEIEKQRIAARGRGRLSVNVKRGNIFQCAYQELNYRSPQELKNKIKVQYEGEAGIDASGLTRDFYTELSRAMFNPDYSLFNLTSNGVSYYANSQSYVNPDHLNFFKFIGRMVGKAIFDGQLLECYFARSLYKMMIGEDLAFEDLEDMDNDCFKNLQWTLDNDVNGIGQYFLVTRDYFGRYEELPLKEGGANIQVTNDNVGEYVEKFTFHKMYINVKDQIDAFLGGFHDIVSRDLISVFNHQELELLISGLPNFDVADLKLNTQLRGYTMDSPQIIWLFEALESYDKHEQALFLQFVTGSSKIPLEGFRALQGMDGVDPFKVQKVRDRENDFQALPKSHTCFNTLDLPEYPSKELLHERLLFAIRECSGFGIA